jgi:hypothetical protein
MKKRKEHKTFSLDADTYERWEKLMRSREDKTLSECIEDRMRQDIEVYDDDGGKQSSAPSAIVSVADEPLPHIWQRLKKDYITPVLEKETQITELEAQAMRLLSGEFERESARIKHVLKNNRIVVFAVVSEFDPLEIDRSKGTMAAYEYRKKLERVELEKRLEQQERYELMQELPNAEAQFLALQRSEEERKRKLNAPPIPTPGGAAPDDGIVQEDQEEYL